MQHTGGILVLLLIGTLVYSQTSTNPAGAPFFSPSLVRQLPLDNITISSTLLSSPSDYSDFYWGYVPENVGGISITVNGTGCDNYLYVMINFVEPRGDPSITFPCESSGYFCDVSRDATINVPYGQVASQSFYAYEFRPSGAFYITVQQNIYTRKDLKRASTCNYTIQAEKEIECPVGTAVSETGDGSVCQSYSNITSNGQTFTGVTSSAGNVYRLDVPENVTYVYAWITSPDNAMTIMVSAGYANTYYYYADRYVYNYAATSASNSSLYVYLIDYLTPMADLPLLFSIQSNPANGSQYSISFHWEYCGATKTGFGDTDPDYSAATMGYNVPPCNEAVTFTNMNLATQNYAFNLPAYNSSISSPGAAYGYLEVPFGTYGAVNISCNSTADNYFVFNKGQNCDCKGPYSTGIYCGGSNMLSLLSEDLYPGGYWTFGACNEDSQPVTFALVVSGSVTAPSPSPVASASPGSSTGEDSSTGIITPAVMLIVLAALSLL